MMYMSYVKGTIYRIICLSNPEIQYIGNTYDNLSYRFRNHKKSYNEYLEGKTTGISVYPYFTKYGIKNFRIVKIKDYIVYRENQKDHKHINAYETLWINKLKCINKIVSFNPLRYNKKLISENKKNYHNKEENKQKRKEIYVKNKDDPEFKAKKKEDDKKYRESHKEEIKVKKKIAYENNKQASLARADKSYKKRKEEILAQSRKKVNCPCCSKKMSFGSLKTHLLTTCPNKPNVDDIKELVASVK